MDTQQVIAIAEKYSSYNDSAKLCLRDAKWCLDKGDYVHAKSRALKSLAHSVGVFHEDYKAVSAAIGVGG